MGGRERVAPRRPSTGHHDLGQLVVQRRQVRDRRLQADRRRAGPASGPRPSRRRTASPCRARRHPAASAVTARDDQRTDGRDRRAGGVGDRDRRRVSSPAPGQPDPQRRRARGVQRDARPTRTGSAASLRPSSSSDGVQRGVEQRRVQAERRRRRRPPAARPRRTPRRRAARRRAGPGTPGRSRSRARRAARSSPSTSPARRRPAARRSGRSRRAAPPAPGRRWRAGSTAVGALSGREYTLTGRARTRRRRRPTTCTWTASVLGQDQRRREGQLVDPVAADLVAGPQRQLDERRCPATGSGP